MIAASDTFFLGTTHPVRGSDASHRGGPAGFVRVDGDQLWWPDYPGNNLFNSFGIGNAPYAHTWSMSPHCEPARRSPA